MRIKHNDCISTVLFCVFHPPSILILDDESQESRILQQISPSWYSTLQIQVLLIVVSTMSIWTFVFMHSSFSQHDDEFCASDASLDD
mmetsp:Transcript_14930/g.22033  ORF Transcript_14930/g.22033 Transcript_14930/m.22033 type:complete len:87 (+) Transcript_14930:96-356(+)